MSEDRCICCGDVIPEGRMVCPICEQKAEKERDLAEELVSKWARGELVEVVRCKDCEWWTKQKASAQGRCERLGMYPTGGWYCANGERGKSNEG